MHRYFTASLTRKTFNLFVIAALLAGLALGLRPVPLAQAGQNGENGKFAVSVITFLNHFLFLTIRLSSVSIIFFPFPIRKPSPMAIPASKG